MKEGEARKAVCWVDLINIDSKRDSLHDLIYIYKYLKTISKQQFLHYSVIYIYFFLLFIYLF